MQTQYDGLIQLTTFPLDSAQKRQSLLDEFAYEFQWHPNDTLDIPSLNDIASAHLVIEHGLENTAVISFLSNSRSYNDLNSFEKKRLLGVSYNNLIDWHIQVEKEAVTYVYNRTKNPTVVQRSPISRDNMEQLRSEAFEKLLGKRPNPNVPALDDALIRTISYWKRELSTTIDDTVTNESLSTLFNAIIFVRAIEDHRRRMNSEVVQTKMLLNVWDSQLSQDSITHAISNTLYSLGVTDIPSYLIDMNLISIFDNVDVRTARALFSAFYRHESVPYEYDFSLMSKHALSRIYEHYVSILRLEEKNTKPAINPTISPTSS